MVPRHLLAMSTDPSACFSTGHGHRWGERQLRARVHRIGSVQTGKSLNLFSQTNQVHCHRFAKGTPTSACQPPDPLTTPEHVWPTLQEAWGLDRLPTLSPESRENFISPGWSPSFHVSWEQTLGFDPRRELQGFRVWCSLQIIESRL